MALGLEMKNYVPVLGGASIVVAQRIRYVSYLTFFLIAVSLQTTPKRKRRRVGEGSEEHNIARRIISDESSFTLEAATSSPPVRAFRCAYCYDFYFSCFHTQVTVNYNTCTKQFHLIGDT